VTEISPIPTNIQYQGADTESLSAAFTYLWENSATLRDSFHLADGPFIVSYDNIANETGVTADAPGYNSTVNGITYIRVNPDVTAHLVTGGVPQAWIGFGASVYSVENYAYSLNERGYITPDDFPTSDMFWTNHVGIISGYDDWANLPNLTEENGQLYYKWAYVNSGAAQAGISFDDNFWSSDFLYDWESSEAGINAIIAVREQSIASREMTLEERLGHEFAHSIVRSGIADALGGQSELDTIAFMNGVREDLGLPPLRDGISGLAPKDLFSTLAQEGYSIPTVILIMESLGKDCFAEGTPILMSDGSNSPIEKVQVGDKVLSYSCENGISGMLVAGRVSQTFQKDVQHLLDVHGLKVTPGHVTLCGEGRFRDRHVPIVDILLSDGALVKEDGELIRMAINKPVGSLEDQLVQILHAETSEDLQSGNLKRGKMRVGTLLFDREGVAVSVLDCLRAQGMNYRPDVGLVSAEGQEPEPLNWFGSLPRPEDYILKRSQETLEGILVGGEWEGAPSALIEGRLRQTAARFH
jgi:hypothetical protein